MRALDPALRPRRSPLLGLKQITEFSLEKKATRNLRPMYAAGKEKARKFPPRAPNHSKTPKKSRTFLVVGHRSSSHCRRDRENPRAGRRESSERSVTRLCREPRAKGERGGRSYRNRGRPRAARLRHGNSRVHEGARADAGRHQFRTGPTGKRAPRCSGCCRRRGRESGREPLESLEPYDDGAATKSKSRSRPEIDGGIGKER